MDKTFDSASEDKPRLRYRLCPRCYRAVSAKSGEHYCINDGTWMLEKCPLCGASITSPYARYCVGCGLEFAVVTNPKALDVQTSTGSSVRNSEQEK